MSQPKAAVIGAGPVGCLAALGLANRGYRVDIIEARPDPGQGSRPPTHDGPRQRSINLALSTRGLTGLAAVASSTHNAQKHQAPGAQPGGEAINDLAQLALRDAVPMKARMIHTLGEKAAAGVPRQRVQQMSQLYGAHGECIHSVSRNYLNELLLHEALVHPAIKVTYAHRLRRADFDAREHARKAGTPEPEADVKLILADADDKETTLYADLVLGCDGIHSAVRSQMARTVRLDFSQEYIDSSYIELSMPPAEDGSFRFDPNHLHIWPRHDFMLIALPNPDRSFTCTLFAPDRVLERHLGDRDAILAFFRDQFADALPHLGEENVVQDLLNATPWPLSTLRCKPYHYKGRALLLGDSAHAMVPFYGQGLNCGFEDVRVFLELLDKHAGAALAGNVSLLSPSSAAVSETSSSGQTSPALDAAEKRRPHRDSGVAVAPSSPPFKPGAVEVSLAREAQLGALAEYTRTRRDDLVAISELALQNYQEMSSRVVSRSYLVRKSLDGLLMKLLPTSAWSSLYSMVTFSNIGYAEALARERAQQRTIGLLVRGAGAVAAVAVGLGLRAGWGRLMAGRA